MRIPPFLKDVLLSTLFGRSLASSEAGGQRIGPLSGIPILGLDATQFRLLRTGGGRAKVFGTGPRWWEYLLHNHAASALKTSLLLNGDERIVVINTPWYLRETHAGGPPLNQRQKLF